MFKLSHHSIMRLCLLSCCLPLLMGCLQKRNVAVVNDQPVTRADFVEQLEARHGMQTLDWLILKSLTEQALKKGGLSVSQEDLQQGMTEWMQVNNVPNDQAFAEFLNQSGMTEKEVREDIWLNLALDKLATKDVKVSDAEMKDFFQKRKKDLDVPEAFVLARIVCKDKATADKVCKKLDENGSWNELVSEYSIDEQTKANNGNTGPVPVTALGPLTAQIKKLENGDHTNPIPASGAFMIIKKTSERPGQPANFDKAKKAIEREVKRNKGKSQQAVVQELRKQAKVEINIPRFLQLGQAFGVQQSKDFSPTQPGPPPGDSKLGKS
ncbi:MAG: peptidyl-prolyl cis-trans isomerase [Armatimonadetes bacterium]|nr:peptidyl-prolyl cis-trans isomerase [Armatimonadota bacterium]